MRDYKKHLIGTAGELEVAKILCLKGWVPSLTTNNCPAFDIFGFNPETNKSVVIQVKTTKDDEKNKRNSFQLGISHENREQSLHSIPGPYVFVHIDINNKFRYFILAREQLQRVISQGVPIETVSRMLGYTNIKTTQIYAKITKEKISQDMEVLSHKPESLEKQVMEKISD